MIKGKWVNGGGKSSETGAAKLSIIIYAWTGSGRGKGQLCVDDIYHLLIKLLITAVPSVCYFLTPLAKLAVRISSENLLSWTLVNGYPHPHLHKKSSTLDMERSHLLT
ncbi:hypothetical protein TEQG_07789 [Trichophyton equinum CBS 127.97]|uniref:Uncharacterized protein n=1 Tax=Trichophyton equinum (strain ATCC MYA-4606 / CBS 127.97) TaxID=559882 RepID=F2Q414_TRIEC|nr:hypothetical protein TEQG_07789 [Trichophyton equinum CBS 127.97]